MEPTDPNFIPAIYPFIDEHFSACVPIISPNSSEQDIMYHDLVIRHMQHKCAVASNGCKKTPDSLCSKGYEATKITTTYFDDKGYPVYKRDKKEDLKTVCTNRLIILDWKGHANVEFSNTARNVLYLFNYLYKGSSKQSVRLDPNGVVIEQNDEIKQYLMGRFLCAMDATWQILGYQTYPAPSPAVRTIKVKTSQTVNALLRKEMVINFIYHAFLHLLIM
jgi:hypothetical protein